MSDLNDRERILALDVRPQSFGFVAFEGRWEVLDWGARSFRHRVRIPLADKVARLLDQYLPDALVVERPRTEKIKEVLEVIKEQAKTRKVRIRSLTPVAVERTFSGRNAN